MDIKDRIYFSKEIRQLYKDIKNQEIDYNDDELYDFYMDSYEDEIVDFVFKSLDSLLR